MSRPAIAEIRLGALRRNYRKARALHGGHVLAVLKADAYGHGAVACASALQPEADGFAVATLEEALQLRIEAGIQKPILLLEGFFEAAELEIIAAEQFWTVIHTRWQVEALLSTPLPSKLHIWLKLDSGMRRIGLEPGLYQGCYKRLVESGRIASLTHMSHLSNAEDLRSDTTVQQATLFQRTVEGLPGKMSLSNSAAIHAWPITHRNWARAGIMLYGVPSVCTTLTTVPLVEPVMQLRAGIIAVRSIEAGDSIGYGRRFTAERPMRIGVVACGYADGYPRAALNGTPVAINGQLSQLIGHASMDMLTVDLSLLPEADVGTWVELWGDTVAVSTVAKAATTIAYELLCRVKRVKRLYSGAEEAL